MKPAWFALMIALFPMALRAADRPNILLIVSDDHGYADVGFHGSKEIPTPHLDRLAQSGVRFSNGYVSHSFCSPTRAGLLTGRYQQRFGHVNNPVYDPLDAKEGLPLSEKLLPEYLRESGYVTGWVGKWHLGSAPAFTPEKRGFSETFGFIGGGHQYLNWTPNQRQYTLALSRNGQTVEVPEHLTLRFGQEAAGFIKRHAEHPWFLYLAFNAPHTPHQPTAERMKRFEHVKDPMRARYAAQVSLLDDAIGAVVESLDSTKQRNRTLVFFFSDNGGPTKNGAANGPLRGAKGDVFEGGIRVPFVISWPDRLPRGAVYDQPVISLDVLATSLAAAGIAAPQRPLDSVNLLPHIRGDNQAAPHQRLFWRNGAGERTAIREGDWKLIRLKNQPDALFNLATDLGESKDLAKEQPATAKRLAEALQQWEATLPPPAFPGSSVKHEDWGPGGANQKNSPATRPRRATRPAQ